MIIVLNGYPGVGKLSIAREIKAIMDEADGFVGGAKLLDHHTLTAPAKALYDPDEFDYEYVRSSVRSAVFDSLQFNLQDDQSPLAHMGMYLFTETAFYNDEGIKAMAEYLRLNQSTSVTLCSVLLTCGSDENERRLISRDVFNDVTGQYKLTDIDTLRDFRASEDLYCFGEAADKELVLDVTELSPPQAAKRILAWILGISADHQGMDGHDEAFPPGSGHPLADY